MANKGVKLPDGTQLGAYTIKEHIGGGAFGDVYKAYRADEKNLEALKVCSSEATDDDVARFRRENDILRTLKHAHIIPALSHVLESDPFKYYTMELASFNLETYLYQHENLTLDQKIKLFEKIALGLEYAHQEGVVHRDLWWKNVLLKRDLESGQDEPKLADFGRARDFNTSPEDYSAQNIWGAWFIMPPEAYFNIWDSPTTDQYSIGDIYALGILLKYILEHAAGDYASRILSDMKLFIQTERPQLSTAPERRLAYEAWLLKNKPEKFFQALDITLLAPAAKSKEDLINQLLHRLCQPDFRLRYQNIRDLINDLSTIV